MEAAKLKKRERRTETKESVEIQRLAISLGDAVALYAHQLRDNARREQKSCAETTILK